ncbi:MAG TPA: hypothetical protein VHU85_14205 [Acidimicrobiales bacterium]|nr:hypothetical protein [Acidimicrobiales bacterium]
MLALHYLPPILAQTEADPWRHHLLQVPPMTAGLAIQATTDLGSQPLAPWVGLAVLAAWVVGSLLLGGLLLRVRDA